MDYYGTVLSNNTAFLLFCFCRMKLFLALVFISIQCLRIHASPLSLALQEEWTAWKQLHSKQYPSFDLEARKQAVWLANREYINEHNNRAHEFGYSLKMNHFGDMVIKL